MSIYDFESEHIKRIGLSHSPLIH